MSPLAQYLVQASLAVVGIAILSGLILYVGRRTGVYPAQGPLRLLARLPLDSRRTIYLVQAGERTLVLGGSEAGLHKLVELNETLSPELPTSSFKDLLGTFATSRAATKQSSDKASVPSSVDPSAARDEP